MSGSNVEAILLRLGLDASGFTKGTREARQELGYFQEKAKDLKGELLGLASQAAAGIGLAVLTREALEFAESVTRVHEQTGLSIESIQYLRLAADQTGTSVDSLAGLVQKMQRQLVEASNGNEKVARGFADLNVNVTELRALAPEDQLFEIAKAISEIHDPAERSAAAVAAFGKSGGEAVPQLLALVEQQDALNAAFERTGGAVSADAIAKVEGLGDAVGEAKTAVVSLATELVGVVAPAFVSFLQTVTETVAGLRLLDGEGSDALVNLDAKIRGARTQLELMIAAQERGDVAWEGVGIEKAILAQDRLLDSLQREYDTRLKLGAQGAMNGRQMVANAEALNQLEQETIANLTASLSAQQSIRDAFADIRFEKEKEALSLLDEIRNEAAIREHEREAEMQKKRVAIRKMTEEEINAVIAESQAQRGEVNTSSWSSEVTTALGALEQMTTGVARHSRAMFELNKAASIANAIINTSQGVTKALAEYPPPLSFVMAAAQAAAGAAQVQAIASTKFGSKTAPSQAAQPVTPTAPVGGAKGGGGGGQAQVMHVQGLDPGKIFSGSMVRSLAERLNEHVRDGGRVEFG